MLKKFAVNMATLTATRVLQTLSTFLAIPILARLLGPADFGVVAIALALVAFALIISDSGLGLSLVQVPQQDRHVWSSVFWLTAGIGATLALALAASAWPISWLMHEPRLVPVILALAPLPLMQACMASVWADLQQREQFRTMALSEVAGSILGVAVAVGLAFSGAGVWALVFQQLTFWLVKSGIMLSATKFRPTFTFQVSELGPHVAFGRDATLLGVVGFVQTQLDPFVIGRFFGAATTGAYSMAERLAQMPMNFFSVPLLRSLYARMVLLRDDRDALRDLCLVSFWIVAAGMFPGVAIVAAASDAYFHVFLSERWLPAAPIFMLTAPTFMAQSVMFVASTMLLAIGAAGRRLKLDLVFASAWIVMLPLSALLGDVRLVAGAYTLTYALVACWTYPRFLEPIGAKVGDMFNVLAAPIIVAVVAASSYALVRNVWPVEPKFEVLRSIVVVALAYGVLALIEWKKVLGHADILRAVLSRRGLHEEPA